MEDVFRVSMLLREHFAKSLDVAAVNPGITNTQRTRIENSKRALMSIKETSIMSAEKDIMGILYRFAVITTVSVAEQLLKSLFAGLVEGNVENLDKPEKFTLTLRDLKEAQFKTDKKFWATQILNDL